MKTKLTSLICTGLLALGTADAFAQSNVTLYGLASLELVHVTGFNNGTAAAPAIGKQTRLDNSKVTNSRLGLRGNEDLGGGWSAVFGLESAIALDTGAQANATKFWNRGSFVGLRSADFGTLTFGRQWNLEDAVMSRYFIGAGYAVFQFSEFLYISDLVDNAVKYISPTMGGLSLQALVAPGEGTTSKVGEVAANFVSGPFEAGATYRVAEAPNGLKDKQSAVGVSYRLGAVRVHGGWAVSDPKALGFRKATAYDVGVVYDMSPALNFTADYVKRDQKNSPDDSDYVRLQGTYNLSKRSSVFVNLVALRNEGVADQKFYGNGARGKDQKVYSLGIRHWF